MRICQLQPHTHHAMNFRDLSGRSRPNDLARGIFPRERFLIYLRARAISGGAVCNSAVLCRLYWGCVCADDRRRGLGQAHLARRRRKNAATALARGARTVRLVGFRIVCSGIACHE